MSTDNLHPEADQKKPARNYAIHPAPRYWIDEELYSLQQKTKHSRNPCTTCDGTGSLALVKGGEVCCGDCGGKGWDWGPSTSEWTVRAPSLVGQMRAEYTSLKYPERRCDIRYMLADTGVGSGTMWAESDLFRTQEEAEAECAVRNAKLLESPHV